MGMVDTIWIKRAKNGPMDAVKSATTVYGKGLLDNADQGGKRQVTIIETEVWLALQNELGVNFPADFRRANVMISGFVLNNSRGRLIKIGECLLRINGETRPCYRMDDVYPGLQAAMESNWRGGVYAEVLEDGVIHIGDAVLWQHADKMDSGSKESSD